MREHTASIGLKLARRFSEMSPVRLKKAPTLLLDGKIMEVSQSHVSQKDDYSF